MLKYKQGMPALPWATSPLLSSGTVAALILRLCACACDAGGGGDPMKRMLFVHLFNEPTVFWSDVEASLREDLSKWLSPDVFHSKAPAPSFPLAVLLFWLLMLCLVGRVLCCVVLIGLPAGGCRRCH